MFGLEARLFLKELGYRLRDTTLDLHFLLQRISVAIQRGNATAILSSFTWLIIITIIIIIFVIIFINIIIIIILFLSLILFIIVIIVVIVVIYLVLLCL